MNLVPKIPTLEGLDQFHGQVLHSQAFKDPSKFCGKDVLIVGLSNSAADTATQLKGHARNIYVSHRQGALVLPRYSDGRPIDHSLTMRLMMIQGFLNEYFPLVAENAFNKFAKSLQDKNFNIRPEWNLSPAPSLKQSVPIISDELVSGLESGKIRSVPALRRVAGEMTVELTDGTIIAIDCIIWCTGYKGDYGILDGDFDPTRNTSPAWSAAPGSNEKPLPRLYQNLFSLQEPLSLVFLGAAAFPSPAFQLYDLATMAVAQVWRGNSSLPSQEEMERAVDTHHDWVCSLAQRATVYPGIVKPGPWMTWVNDAAGTGVNEMLGYGIAGWTFWWREKGFCEKLMDGICSPHIYRLFDGKRKKWDGAKEAILKANNAIC
ncbi:hypothetical protein CC78DRAFT_538321 [Lojkania enalia]|uniref:Dimethylaniline monooxygenase 2 n=1 Tax=Lojkania enalia TaxID=147567 RepID=A0A9P4N0J6_9PLEO|nr:hypothetical protein CC78DRAFT_538321 [Didymosphaeria enalia]